MKTRRRIFLSIALSVTYAIMLPAQHLDALQPHERSKIDPLLQHAISMKERQPLRPMMSVESYGAGTRLSAAAGDVVGVLIQSATDIHDYVRSIGGVVGSRHGNVYTAFVPVQYVGRVAQVQTVQYIEASRRLYPSLDLSRAKTGADVLQSFTDPARRLTGKGIIIGFTDSGINTDHPNFKLPDGRTRILYVWDQYASSGGFPPAGFSYGIEKDSSAINAHTWLMSDDIEHGTHVSGIAAGNGLPSLQYIGMAPEADIIMVANRGNDLFDRGLTTVGTLDGYDYIRAKANALHKRFVINTSQGTNLGPHDGTTLFEQAVNADGAAGNIVCISAGNEATSARHASAIVTPVAPQEIACNIEVGSGLEVPMDIWYKANDRLVLRIKESTETDYVSIFPPRDSTIVYSSSSVDITATTKIGSPLNGDNEIYITFLSKTASCTLVLQFSAQAGNTLPDGGRVDLWWERNYPVDFISHIDQSITLGMPACADSAITVASYNNRAGYGFEDDISSFSAIGPRRDGRIKPDIAGIGGSVISSVGSSGYASFSGTSMSSPHVAGAVALLLQQDTTLTNYRIKQKLCAAATADNFTGPVPNPTWGYGKLNVLKAAGYRGIPVINVLKDTIRFQAAFIGTKTDDSVAIKNLGNEELAITSVTTSDPIFSVRKTSLTVPPRGMEQLIVSVTPTSVGDFSGTLIILSNDSTHPIDTVTILGHSDYPPNASISPDSLSFVVNEGDSVDAILTLENSGIGQLSYETYVDYSSSAARNPEFIDAAVPGEWKNQGPFRSRSAQSIPPKYSTSPLLPLIIQDPIGDATRVDISEMRGQVSGGMLTLQIVTATHLDPPNFAGYLGLDIDQNAGSGMRLPYGLRTQDIGCEFVLSIFDISYRGIQLYDTLGILIGTYTPVIDTIAGNITFSLPLTALRNDDGLINLAAVFGDVGPTDYVPDSGHGTVGVAWLSTIPRKGTVSPSGSSSITVRVKTDDLDGGDFAATLVVATNDPLHRSIRVPTSLHVIGKPVMRISPDTLRYGFAYIGIPRVDTLHIRNIGSDVLNVSSATVSDTAFHLHKTSFSVAAGARQDLLITYTASAAGPIAAIISITSNDSSALTATVPIRGESVYPPIITVSPDSIAASLKEGDSTTTKLTIGNAGLGVLEWEIPHGLSSPSGTQASMSRNEAERIAVSQKQSQTRGNNSGSATISPFALGTLLTSTGRTRVLLWTGYSDNNAGGELENTMNAIRLYTSNVVFDTTTTTSSSELSTLLAQTDVFIVPEQELIYDLTALGYVFAPALTSFVQSGRTMIVLDFGEGGSTKFLNATGLLTISNVIPATNFTAIVHDTASPLVVGVSPAFTSMNGSNYHTSTNGRKIIREQLTGNNVVTVRDVGTGRVIYFGMDFYSYNADMARVLANAVSSSLSLSLMTAEPNSGTIPSGGSQEIALTLNAKYLRAGDYAIPLIISSNDPLRSRKNIPISLHVIGRPIIRTSPDTLNFGKSYVGLSSVDTLSVQNLGSETLQVSAVTVSDTAFHINKTSFSVAPGARECLLVTFTASSPGPFSATLAISCNDSSALSVQVPICGESVYPPVIAVSPDSLSFVVGEKDSASAPLTISNTGRGSLSWSLNRLSGVTASLPSAGFTLPSAHATAYNADKKTSRQITAGTITNTFADLTGKRIGILTSYGYSLIASDLTSRGARVSTMIYSPPLPLSILDTLDIIAVDDALSSMSTADVAAMRMWVQSGHGILIMGDDDYSMSNINALLEGTGITEYYLGNYFDGIFTDITPHPITEGVDTVWSSSYGSYSVATSPALVLVRDDSARPHIVISALGAGSVAVACNEIADDYALSISGDTRTLVNRLFDWLAGNGTFVDVEPASGTLAPDGSQVVLVKANARSVSPGLHRTILALYNNDPLRNPKNVPISLRVLGKPVIRIIPDTLNFGKAYIGIASTDTLCIKNIGSDVLQVRAVTVSDTAFHPNKTSFSVAVNAQENLLIAYTPHSAGAFAATITVQSNDSSALTVSVPIRGEAIYPPKITVSSDSLVFALQKRDSVTVSIKINNSGIEALEWHSMNSQFIAGLLKGQIDLGPIRDDTPLFPLFEMDGNGIYQTHPYSGAVVKKISSMGFDGNAELAYDGAALFVLKGWRGANMIYKMNATTGAILDSIVPPTAGQTSTPSGIASDGKHLFLSDFMHAVYVIDQKTKIVIRTLQLAPRIVGGLAYAGNRNTFFGGTDVPDICEINGQTGAVVRRIPSPGNSPIFGLGYSNSADLIIVTAGSSTYFMDPNTGTTVSSVMGFYSGIAADEAIGPILTAQPDHGTIAAGDTDLVVVSCKTKNIDAGTYKMSLSIFCNDPRDRTKIIPTTITVLSGPQSASDEDLLIPKVFALYQNYPNPFNPATTIRYDIPKHVRVQLRVYNILGERITTLVDEEQSPRQYTVQWDGRTESGAAATGIYFAVIRAGEFSKVMKMVLLK